MSSGASTATGIVTTGPIGCSEVAPHYCANRWLRGEERQINKIKNLAKNNRIVSNPRNLNAFESGKANTRKSRLFVKTPIQCVYLLSSALAWFGILLGTLLKTVSLSPPLEAPSQHQKKREGAFAFRRPLSYFNFCFSAKR